MTRSVAFRKAWGWAWLKKKSLWNEWQVKRITAIFELYILNINGSIIELFSLPVYNLSQN